MKKEPVTVKVLKINVKSFLKNLGLKLSEEKTCGFRLTQIPQSLSTVEIHLKWKSDLFHVYIYENEECCVRGLFDEDDHIEASLFELTASKAVSGTQFMNIWEKICSQINPKIQNLTDLAKIKCKFSIKCINDENNKIYLKIWRIFTNATFINQMENLEFSGSWYENFNYKLKIKDFDKLLYFNSVKFLSNSKIGLLKQVDLYEDCKEFMEDGVVAQPQFRSFPASRCEASASFPCL